jgi:glycine dehydrogenase subunit 1
MSYIPHTEADRQAMLAAIGAPGIDELFEAVPAGRRFPKLDLPPAASELEIAREMQALAEANDHAGDFALFRGAGAYHHFVPAAVSQLLLRGEFYTTYTPYQPEVSQGTLQAIFEFQSMIAALTGMDAANASHYDGATSLAEAVTVAAGHKKVKGGEPRVVLSPYIHPQYRAVTRTYHQGTAIEFVGDDMGGTVYPRDLNNLIALIDERTVMVAAAYPNFFGQIEDLARLAAKAHEVGALFVVVANPLALALLKPPSEFDADIVVGEGQPLGIPLSYGGPYVGFFACKSAYVRRIAGRIVGETVDADGRRAFVMTLRPREQDIRREKASSNICTNQGLMALAATLYMGLMGKQGMQQSARLSYHRAHYAADRIAELPGFSIDRSLPFFNECVVRCPKPVGEINAALVRYGIIGGYDLAQDYPHMQQAMLLCVTDMNDRQEIDNLVDVLREVTR